MSGRRPFSLQAAWPLVPLLFSLGVWAYHEYELNRSAGAIRTSFDTIRATVEKSTTHRRLSGRRRARLRRALTVRTRDDHDVTVGIAQPHLAVLRIGIDVGFFDNLGV